MQIRIITECFFDTLLIEKIVKQKDLVWHMQGCNNVVESLKNERIKDYFKVGVIDKDKNPIKYLNDFEIFESEGFNFYWKKENNLVVIIQLNPPLEQWILNICETQKIDLSKIGLSNELNQLRKSTKSSLIRETEELKQLVKTLINSGDGRIGKLISWMNHLITNKNNFDINLITNV